MALFLGNLSPRIRCDELEQVFRRFGRCTVQLKDGYGFVIYDVPANAERALRALRGKVICREQISLTWANKQPRPFPKFTESGRFSELQHGRNFIRDENNGVRSRSTQDQRDFTTGKGKYPNRNSGEKGCVGDDIGEHGVKKGQNLKEGVMEEGDALEPNPLENDRWGEPVGDSTNNAVENGTEFDRYEPYHGFDRRDETEKQHITSSYDSVQGISPRRASREQSGFDNPRPQQSCYTCGLIGHKMYNCPKADAPRRGFGRRQNRGIEFRGRYEGGIKKLRHTSWRRSDGRGIMISRRVNDRKESGSWKHRRLVKRTENFSEKRKNSWSLRGRDSQGKERGRKENGSPNKRHRKKARTSDSSSLHLDSTASFHSSSSSSKSGSRISSHSQSRSVSSRSHSLSSSSRSTSASSFSESRSSRSRLRLSSSRSLSLSISLGRQSPSPRKVQMDRTATSPKDDLRQVLAPNSEHLFLDQRSPGGDLGCESSECKDMSTVQKGELNDMQPPEEGAFRPMKSSLQNFREMESLQKSESVQMDITISPSETLKPQTLVNCQLNSSTRMSSQEMCMVLKHYGLKVPEGSELHLSVDAFFGAARLWPWEMIYYRRLKKGTISTENYARRIEQNREFGIVDKFIRSSSGWGERDVNTS